MNILLVGLGGMGNAHYLNYQHIPGAAVVAAVGRTDYSGRRQDSYYILRWYAHYTLNEHVKLHLRVENLTNQRFVAEPWDADSLLNAGTSVHAGCTLSF